MSQHSARQTALGSLQVFAAEALGLPAGLLIAAYLTRQLGPELYGALAVATTIVLWVEISLTMMFSRTTVKFVAEAEDKRLVASALAQAQVVVSLVAAVILIAIAPFLAAWLNASELVPYLSLFALEIPLFALADANRSTLIGRGGFGQRALLTAIRWLIRLGLVFLLVGRLSVAGAILASIGAVVVELIVARLFVKLTLLRRYDFPYRRLWGYALPLFFYALGMRLFNQIDLLVVKARSETSEAAGYYAAAQNLTMIVPNLIAASFAPLLLATLTQALQRGQPETMRAMVRQTMRLVWCLLPFAALAAGVASEVVVLFYGPAFSEAGPLMAMLMFAALAVTLISVTTAILTAAGRPGWTLALTAPLLPLAFAADWMLVPHFGAIGAAAATTALAWLGAVATTIAVYRQCGIYPAPATILRTGFTALIAYALASAWRTTGAWLIVELASITVVIVICLLALGEWTTNDWVFVRSLLWRRS